MVELFYFPLLLSNYATKVSILSLVSAELRFEYYFSPYSNIEFWFGSYNINFLYKFL